MHHLTNIKDIEQAYSGPTVLLLMDGKEVYRASQFIDLEELKYNINRYIELLAQ